MSETPKPPGRLYLRVRAQAPKVLGKRVCPNCRREFPIENFKRVRRGRIMAWLCATCFSNRRITRLP